MTFKPARGQAAGKRNASSYAGALVEPEPKEIPLLFEPENLAMVLREAVDETAEYSHFDIARWCAAFAEAARESDEAVVAAAGEIAFEVDTQWSLTLFNSYSRDAIVGIDLDTVSLPPELWASWSNRLETLLRQAV